MATNSKREQILVRQEAIIEAVNSISKVIRVMPNYEQLQQFANTQFPVCAIVGKMPVPVPKKSSRTYPQTDQFISTLKIENFVYMVENETPDTVLSDIADDLWVALYSDPTYGGVAMGVEVTPDENAAYWAPYLAFKMTSVVTYEHSTGGI